MASTGGPREGTAVETIPGVAPIARARDDGTRGLLTRLNFRAYPRVKIALHWFVGQVLRTNALSGGLD